MTKNKRAKIETRGTWILWPDKNGNLILPSRLSARLSALPLRHLPRSRPMEQASPRYVERLLSSLSSLLLRSSDAGLFGVAIESLFVTWCMTCLQNADFEALTLDEVRDGAELELGLSLETINHLLILHTRPDAEFCSDGTILTLRE